MSVPHLRKIKAPAWNGTLKHLKHIIKVTRTLGWSIVISRPKHITKKAKRWMKKHKGKRV